MPDSSARFDARDVTYAATRGLALAGGALWAYLLEPSPTRDGSLAAFGVFFPYCVLLYGAGHRILRSRAKDTFYWVAFVSDVVFLALLLRASGGIASPFVAALAPWSAMYASYFGLRGGVASAIASVALVVAYGVHGGIAPWRVIALLALAAIDGPVLGYLFAQAGRESRDARAAREEMAKARHRLDEEQSRVIETEKHRSVAVLAAGLAHELNNPLAGIMQCARALQDGSLPKERHKEYLDAIMEGLGRLQTVIEGVRDYARQRPTPPSDLDAAELVASCVRMIAPMCEEAGVRVVSSVPPDVHIRAEAGQLRKALSNVMINAVYFSPRGEEITISATRRGYMWGIAIADHGPGISKDNLAKVTEPFFTTKPPGEGTGLGLAITYGVLRSFGGELALSSDEGRGTTVTMWLPAAGGGVRA